MDTFRAIWELGTTPQRFSAPSDELAFTFWCATMAERRLACVAADRWTRRRLKKTRNGP
jgi:hypothetical protein